jgi:hypothetical protein
MFKEGMEQGSKTHVLILGNALLQFRHFDWKMVHIYSKICQKEEKLYVPSVSVKSSLLQMILSLTSKCNL